MTVLRSVPSLRTSLRPRWTKTDLSSQLSTFTCQDHHQDRTPYIIPSGRRTSLRHFWPKSDLSPGPLALSGQEPHKPYFTTASAVDHSGQAVDRSVPAVHRSVQHRRSLPESTCNPWNRLRFLHLKPFFLKHYIKLIKCIKPPLACLMRTISL